MKRVQIPYVNNVYTFWNDKMTSSCKQSNKYKYSNNFCSDIISQDCINYRVCIMLNKNWYNDFKMMVGKHSWLFEVITPENILRKSQKSCKPSLKNIHISFELTCSTKVHKYGSHY